MLHTRYHVSYIYHILYTIYHILDTIYYIYYILYTIYHIPLYTTRLTGALWGWGSTPQDPPGGWDWPLGLGLAVVGM